MSLKPFEKNDIFKNVIKTHPRFEIKISSGFVYINNSLENYIKLNDANIGSSSS